MKDIVFENADKADNNAVLENRFSHLGRHCDVREKIADNSDPVQKE